MNRIAGLFAFMLFIAASCSPATVSRIGLARPQRPEGCPVAVLEPGAVPDRPIVDIGVVSLTNCQEYHSPPCRKWLEKAVCELGGEVAYLPDPRPPQNDIDPMSYRVLVAVYAAGGASVDEGVCREPEDDSVEPEPCE